MEREKKVDALHAEIDGMRQSQDKVFQAPPVEWISDRVGQIDDLLQLNSGESALALRKLLGPIMLEPQIPENGKSYYIAQSSINTLAIIEPLPGITNENNGSTTVHWWALSQPIRTSANLSLLVKIQFNLTQWI